MNKMLIFCLVLITLNSCRNKTKQDNSGQTETRQNATLSATELEEIKQHLEDQKRIVSDEVDFENPYDVTERDLELASKVMLEGLKDNGFKVLTEEDFNKRIKYVFNIAHLKTPHYKIHAGKSYLTLFGNQYLPYKQLLKSEFYSYINTSNYYLMKKEHLITELNYLEELIKINKDNTYKVTVSPYLIHKNKYVINNNPESLNWLLKNDQFFLSKLLTDFGYDKEAKINKMVLDSVYKEHASVNPTYGSYIAGLFFVKDSNHKLQIRENLLKYVEDHTSATDNRFIYALGDYVWALYDDKDRDQIFNENQSKKFTELEKAKIVAYIANIEAPAIDKYKTFDSVVWNNAGSTLYNISVSHPEIIKLIEKNNYFGLPRMKKIIADLEEEAPPPPGDPE